MVILEGDTNAMLSYNMRGNRAGKVSCDSIKTITCNIYPFITYSGQEAGPELSSVSITPPFFTRVAWFLRRVSSFLSRGSAGVGQKKNDVELVEGGMELSAAIFFDSEFSLYSLGKIPSFLFSVFLSSSIFLAPWNFFLAGISWLGNFTVNTRSYGKFSLFFEKTSRIFRKSLESHETLAPWYKKKRKKKRMNTGTLLIVSTSLSKPPTIFYESAPLANIWHGRRVCNHISPPDARSPKPESVLYLRLERWWVRRVLG